MEATTKPQQQLDVQIRWMIRRDMPEVLAIEQDCFQFPWSEEVFLVFLKQRNCIGMIAEHKGRVVGYMVYELHRDLLQLVNFAVSPAYHREGVGSQLIEKLKGKLSQQRRRKIADHVRETNLPMQLFLKSQGFSCRAVEREAFDGIGEDAYVFVFKAGENRS